MDATVGFGKLIGKIAGETIASPFTAIREGAAAVDEAGKTIAKRVDQALEPDERKPRR